jgi:hypothetical protein
MLSVKLLNVVDHYAILRHPTPVNWPWTGWASVPEHLLRAAAPCGYKITTAVLVKPPQQSSFLMFSCAPSLILPGALAGVFKPFIDDA